MTAVANMLCLPIDGLGALDLALSWPTDALVNPIVQASLTPEGGTVSALTFTLTGTSATYGDPALPEGYYTLSLKLVEQNVPKTTWAKVETVLILAGQTTTGAWTLTETDLSLVATGGVAVQLAADAKAPIVLDLTGKALNLTLGSSLTVAATGMPAPDSWQWYLDGDALSGETASSISIGGALAEGAYSLDVVAKKGDVAGSAGFRFRVAAVSIPRTGLVAEYLFEGNANDTSGNSKNGTVNGPIADADRFAAAGKALRFDGINDWVDTGYNLRQTDGSISVWFNADVIEADFVFNQIKETPILSLYLSEWGADGGALFIRNDAGSNANLGFGCYNGSVHGRAHFMQGLIDDVRIYDRALTEVEIGQLYHEGGYSQ